MERLKVLASAAALGTFTVAKLAAHSGVNANTVRSILNRDSTYFESLAGDPELSTSDSGSVARGRRPNTYRVSDLEGLRRELFERMPETGAWSSGAGYSPTQAGNHDAAWDAVEDAEDRFIELQAQTGRPNSGARTLLVALETIRETVRPLLAAPSRWKVDPGSQVRGDDDDMLRRATLVNLFAELQIERIEGADVPERASRDDRFSRATRALHGVADALPGPVLSKYWMTSFQEAESLYWLPPVQLITPIDVEIKHLFPELAEHDWEPRHDADSRLRRWVPSWAGALAETGLASTVIFGFEGAVAHAVARLLPSLLPSKVRLPARPVVIAEDVREVDFRTASMAGYQIVARKQGMAGMLCAAHSQAPWNASHFEDRDTLLTELLRAHAHAVWQASATGLDSGLQHKPRRQAVRAQGTFGGLSALPRPRQAKELGSGGIPNYFPGDDHFDIASLLPSPRSRSALRYEARVSWCSPSQRYGMVTTETGHELFFDHRAFARGVGSVEVSDMKGAYVSIDTHDGLVASKIRPAPRALGSGAV